MLIFDYFLLPNKRSYWLYLISAAFISAGYFLLKKERINLQKTKAYWWSAEAKLDYAYFIVVFMIKAYLLMPFIISAQSITLWVYQFMLTHFGYYRIQNLSSYNIMLLYTATTFILSDLSRYALHRLMHKVSFLWHFHKVHHSASKLNPITFYRVHPVENLLFGFRYSIVIGVVTGIFVYFFGANLKILDVLGANILLFCFNLIGGNLRHSHIMLAYPKWLEKWLISPAQHQLHHHISYTNKNYGGYLAIWDRLFKSLEFSQITKNLPKEQQLNFGLGESNATKYQSILKLLLRPFVDLYQQIFKP